MQMVCHQDQDIKMSIDEMCASTDFPFKKQTNNKDFDIDCDPGQGENR